MFSAEEANLIATIVSAAGQGLLALSLMIAAIRNGLKGNIRPGVATLAFYFIGAFALTFLRLITRIYVMNGGDSATFVNGGWYTMWLGFHAMVTWALYIVLNRSYKGQQKDPEPTVSEAEEG